CPRLSLRHRVVERRHGRQRPSGRARRRERGGVCPAVRLPPARRRAPGGLLSRGGAALGHEAPRTARRHRVLPRGRRRVHGGGARALPRRPAGRPGRGAARAVGRADRAAGRVVFNASSWARSDVLRVPDGAARRLAHDGREWPAVDLPDGSALVVAREVPALGYLALTESERATNPPQDDGAALEAQAGGFHVVLDPASGAIHSLTTGDGVERVRPAAWS